MIREKLVSFIINSPKSSFSLFSFFVDVSGLFNLKTDFSYRTWYGESDPLLKVMIITKRFGNDITLSLRFIIKMESLIKELLVLLTYLRMILSLF